MSFRSPTPDGLAVSPNAAAFGGNPAASPQELQSHHYWGRYALVTQLPNVGFVDGVAVVGANAASAPAYDKLAPGDLAFIEGAAPPANSNIYVCVDRGTLAGSDARWVTLGNATFTQTIRDAHVIVVGQDTWLAGLGGGAIPPNAANNFNLSAVSGDVASITCDYLDPGDGSELTLAFSAAAAGGIPIDIRLRPMELNLTAATTPLTVPPLMSLIGAGIGISSIIGRDQGNQVVFSLGSGVSMEDITVQSPAPTAATAGVLGGVINAAKGSTIRRCQVLLVASVAFNRTQTYGIYFDSPNGRELVDDCDMRIDTLDDQPAKDTSVAIKFGVSTASITNNPTDPEVRDTTVTEATSALGSAAIAVWIENVSGGRCFNVEHVKAREPRSAFQWTWSFTPGAAVTDRIRGPKFIECRLEALSSETLGADQRAFIAALLGTPNLALGVFDTMFHDCVAFFAAPVAPVAIERTGFQILVSTTDNSSIRFSTIESCRSTLSRKAIVLDASAGNGKLDSVRVSDSFGPSQTTVGAVLAYGLRARGSAAVAETIRALGVQNCDFRGAPAGGFGISLDDIGVEDSIILGNNLTTTAGTALNDAGTGTEAAHNIV